LLEKSEEDALRPADYDIEWLLAERERLARGLPRPALERDQQIVAVELRATTALLRWGRHLGHGRISPAGGWERPARSESAFDVLGAAIDRGRLGDVATKLRPPHGEYSALLKLRREYGALVKSGGWPRVRAGGTVRPGRKDSSIPSLRMRLAASGDLDRQHVTGSSHFDTPVVDALRSFQQRHGLSPSGTLDESTRDALNVSAAERLRQIDVNIERWRLAPRELGSRHVLVNIPDYYLGLVGNGRTQLGMRVVVGGRETPTPVLSDEMSHIVFNPYWNVPDSIAADEMLPALMSDPKYL
jgi:murein L,D-transpeptidase YcbB/YkuD